MSLGLILGKTSEERWKIDNSLRVKEIYLGAHPIYKIQKWLEKNIMTYLGLQDCTRLKFFSHNQNVSNSII